MIDDGDLHVMCLSPLCVCAARGSFRFNKTLASGYTPLGIARSDSWTFEKWRNTYIFLRFTKNTTVKRYLCMQVYIYEIPKCIVNYIV